MKNFLKLAVSIILLTITTKISAAEYIWPIDEKNAQETYIEYGYGRRNYSSLEYDKKYNYAPYEEYYYKNESHFGVDITGIKGNTYEVVSVVNGRVLTTSNDQYYKPGTNHIDRNQRKQTSDGGGYGNYIVIEEDITGKCFLYAHLKAGTITLKNNDRVTLGQKIGIMGSSGDSGHMHLHFEVRPNAEKVLPLYSLGGQKNLVPTLIYGRETLDPTIYIGEKPGKVIKETEKTTKEEKQAIVNPVIKHETIEPSVPTEPEKKFETVEQKETNNIAEDKEKFIQGDVNKDGKISAVDTSYAQRLYIKIIEGKTLTEEDKQMLKQADMNNDGKLNATDINAIKRKYLELSSM